MVKAAPPAVRHLTLIIGVCAAAAGCGSSVTTTTAPAQVLRCVVTLAMTNPAMPAAGGAGRVNVNTDRECAWTATSDATWLSITSAASGQGEGSVEFRAAANPDPIARRGSLMLNDQRADVSQSAADCAITLSESGSTFSQAGGTGTIGVVASSPLCTWTASTDAQWISITSAPGKGSAAVSFVVSPTTGPPRAGTVSVAGQQFNVTQGQGCSYVINPQSQTFGSTGGNGTINLATGPGCPWVSGTNVPWIRIIQGASGAGPGVVTFAVDPTTGPVRRGTVRVADSPFTVEQSPGCSFQVAPTTLSVSAAGGTGTIAVTAGPGCAWTAASGAPWITVTGGPSGTGDGTVTFSAQATSGPARSGTLTVANQTVSVNQTTGCAVTISPESQSFTPSGGTGDVAVTAPTGCAWAATSNAPWLTITQGSSGSGNGTVRLSVAGNTGPARSGTLTIGGRTLTVNQAGACAFGISPQQQPVAAAGGSVNVAVTTTAGCTWTAASNASWISIAQGASGTGQGTVTLSVASTTGPARNGTATIAGNTFTVQQASGCTFSVSPTSRSHNANGGGNSSFNVTTNSACSWKAVSNVPWITIASGADTGNGRVDYDVGRNTGAARTGTITVGTAVFTVMQSGS